MEAAGFSWAVSSTLQTRAIDARRPFLNLQQGLYQEATKTAALLATASDAAEVQTAEIRFWQLYWGELALVENGGIKTENGGIEGAMVQFGNELAMHSRDRTNLKLRSLELAHVCRDSLAVSWGVRDWRAPA